MNEPIEILLVEDNPSDAGLIIRTLQSNHLCNNVVHLNDGEEALEFIFAKGKHAARNIANRPKMILLDLGIPKVDGLDVLRAIKADERTRTIPVIVMTSSEKNADVSSCYALGANSYVVKPVDFERFAKAVAGLGMYWMLVNQELK